MSAWHLRGLVLPDDVVRDVYVVEGRVTFTPVEDAVTLADDVVLLPGLVDAHAHLSLFSPAGDDAPPEERVRASARAQLDAGVLALREPGSPDYASHGLGPHEGLPRVVTAGHLLAAPGRYFPGLGREVSDDELVAAALEELAHSGDWVKLIGDFPDPDGSGLSRTFSAAAVTEVVRQVHAAGGRVAMHCALPEVIQTGIDAGLDSLEHASFLQLDQVVGLAAAGCAWVPTCSINEAVAGMVPSVEPMLRAQGEVLQAAAEAGVTILAGTDAGMGPHGLVREEIGHLRRAGVGSDVALGAGSWTARSFLGLPGIEEGAPADLVAFRLDPREHPDELVTPYVVVLDGVPQQSLA